MVFYNFPQRLGQIRPGICGVPNQNTISQVLSLHEMQAISWILGLSVHAETGKCRCNQIPTDAPLIQAMLLVSIRPRPHRASYEPASENREATEMLSLEKEVPAHTQTRWNISLPCQELLLFARTVFSLPGTVMDSSLGELISFPRLR